MKTLYLGQGFFNNHFRNLSMPVDARLTNLASETVKCYFSLRARQQLEPFHVLVGPNASGKTTFLDVVSFLGDLLSKGPLTAVSARTKNFHDLLWWRAGDSFELAIEAAIPEKMRSLLRDPKCEAVRYEIAMQIDEKSQEILIQTEKVLLRAVDPEAVIHQRSLFSVTLEPPPTIIIPTRAKGTTLVVNKVQNRNDNFYSEVYREKGKGWAPSFKLGPHKSALANLPADEANFPVTSWLKSLLTENITKLMLNSLLIRQASPPGQGRNLFIQNVIRVAFSKPIYFFGRSSTVPHIVS